MNAHTIENDVENLEAKPSENVLADSPPVQEEAPNFLCGFCLALLLACGGFIFGYDTGTISGFLSMGSYVKAFGEQDDLGIYNIPVIRSGLLVSMFSVGAIFGALSSSKLVDTLGRVKTISVYNLLYCVAVIVQLVTFSSWIQIMVGRCIAGISVGAFCVTIPMLISESVPTDLRGAAVSTFQLMVTFGILVGNIFCFAFRNVEDSKSYKIPLGISLAFSLVLFGVLFIMPESPRFLLVNERIDDARMALSRTCRMDPDSQYIQKEIAIMVKSVEADKEAGEATWSDLIVGKPRIFYRLCVGLVLLSTQQLCGANYFFYYGTALFKSIGSGNSFANAMILSGVNLACTVIGMYLVSLFGRRTVLMLGSYVMLFAFVVFASLGSFSLTDAEGLTNTGVGKCMIFFACIFILGFAATWAPLAFVVMSEIFPQRIRSKGMSLATCALWLWNFLIGFFTPMITAKIGYKYGYVFSGCILFSLFFIYFGLHETKGLTLDEIDDMYAKRVPASKSAQYVRELVAKNKKSSESSENAYNETTTSADTAQV